MADVAPQRPFPLGPPNGEVVVASLGILFFVPQIIKSIGVTENMTVGWLTMIPLSPAEPGWCCGGSSPIA
jgi:hypothetical protein